MEERFRNAQTAAGFPPKACETRARKSSETLPTERTKQLVFSSENPSPASSSPTKCHEGRSAVEERFRNTQTAAGFPPKACETRGRKSSETLPTERTNKLVFSSENPSPASSSPTKCREGKKVPWRSGSETPKQQQDSAQSVRNPRQKKFRNVAY